MKHLIQIIALLVFINNFVQGHTPSLAQPNDLPRLTALAWSPLGDRVAIGYSDGSLAIHNIVTGDILQLPLEHTDEISQLAWNPDNKRLASGSFDSDIIIWNSKTGEVIARLAELTDVITWIGWNNISQQISASQFGIKGAYWNTTDYNFISDGNFGSLVEVKPNATHSVFAAAQLTIIGIINPNTLSFLRFIPSPERPEGGRYSFYLVAWHPNDQQIAGGSEDGWVRIWDLATDTFSLNLRATDQSVVDWGTTAVKYVGYHFDGTQLVSLAADGTFRVWDATTGAMLSSTDISETPIFAAALSPDGTKLAYGGENGALIIVAITDLLPLSPP